MCGVAGVPPERPTILQIIPRLDTGGAELATIEITEAIVSAGGRAIVVTEGGRMADRVTAAGGEIVVLAAGTKNPWAMWRNAARLAALIEHEGIDLVHARSRAPAWSALLASRRTRRPFVTTYHGAYTERGPAKRLYNSVMARGDVVIANSRYTAGLIGQRYGTPAERIAMIARGVDFGRFDAEAITPARITALRTSWTVDAGQRVILHAARLTAWKGQAILIEAVAALAREDRLGDAVLVLAGDAQGRDAYARSLGELAARLGIADRVRLAGHVDDMPAAYASAWVTVVASIEPEAFGRAAAEALAVGCPVIATNLGAPPETVLAEPAVAPARCTGWLAEPTAAGLAGKLGLALAMPDAVRREMGRTAIADMRARFSLALMQRQTLAVYDRLLGTDLLGRIRSAGQS